MNENNIREIVEKISQLAQKVLKVPISSFNFRVRMATDRATHLTDRCFIEFSDPNLFQFALKRLNNLKIDNFGCILNASIAT